MATIQTPNGVTLRVSAKTGLNGLSERTQRIIAGMAQAAPAAGISVIDITAGKEGGHLSHAHGTEVDLKAYSADGSLWTTQQRVALAAGAQAGGADRFGLYSFGKGKLGSGTMHVGYSGPGRPPAVWGADSKVRGDASRRFTDPAEKAFLASYQAGQPFDIASLGLTPLGNAPAPQDAQSAIASLMAPAGGTQVPEQPSPLMAFNPGMPEVATPGAQPSGPPMPATPKELPPQWAQNGAFPPVAGNAEQATMLGGTTPPMPQIRNQATLDQQKADQLDQVMFGAGPHRGDFARGRPEGRWLEGAGGAPDASAVPTPNISPLAPAVGGPNDRRPQPPMPSMRPEGRFVAGAGGAPDAGSVPSPPPRGTPYAPAFPDLYGEQPQYRDGLSAAMGGPPSRTGDMSAAMGNAPPMPAPPPAPPPPPQSPQITDSFKQSFDLANDMNTTRENTDWWTGALTPQASPPMMPGGGSAAYGPMPPTGPDFSMSDANPSRIDGMSAKMGGPPAPYAPDFNFAGTPSASGPQSGAMTGEGAPSSQTWSQPGSGQWMTGPPMPTPPPAVAQNTGDQFNLSFSPGGPGMIMDMGRSPSPAPVPDMPFGVQPAYAGPQGDADWSPSNANAATIEQPSQPRVVGSPADADFYSRPPNTVGSSWSQLQGRFDDSAPKAPPSAMASSVVDMPEPILPGTSVAPFSAAGMPGTWDGPNNFSPFSPPPSSTSPTLPTPPPAPQEKSWIERQIARVFGGGLLGPAGAIGAGLLGNFGQPSAFSAFAGSGGTAPSTGFNGQGFNTTYRHGSVTGNPNMQGTMWNRSNGGSVGYVTDPVTGSSVPIHAYSPNTL